jgi:Spy/CpxP family protein refolding chaperone
VKTLRSFLLPAALSLTLIAPIAAGAQQATQAPSQGAPAAQTQRQGAWQGHRGRHGFMRMLRGVTLTEQQKTQIRQIRSQFRRSHPRGSQTDPQARRQAREQLRQQIMNVLTPAQRAQVQQNMLRMRQERNQNGGQPQP